MLEAGAGKVSVSSAAYRRPELITEIIREFGPDALTVAIDVDVNPALPSGYEVYIDGGRTATAPTRSNGRSASTAAAFR